MSINIPKNPDPYHQEWNWKINIIISYHINGMSDFNMISVISLVLRDNPGEPKTSIHTTWNTYGPSASMCRPPSFQAKALLVVSRQLKKYNQKTSKLNAPNFVEHGEHGFGSQKTGIKTNLNTLVLSHYQLYVCTCQCAHFLEFDIKSIWFDTTTFWVLHHSTQLMASSSSSSDPQHIVAILARIVWLCRAKIFVLPKTNSSPPEIRPSQKETSSSNPIFVGVYSFWGG